MNLNAHTPQDARQSGHLLHARAATCHTHAHAHRTLSVELSQRDEPRDCSCTLPLRSLRHTPPRATQTRDVDPPWLYAFGASTRLRARGAITECTTKRGERGVVRHAAVLHVWGESASVGTSPRPRAESQNQVWVRHRGWRHRSGRDLLCCTTTTRCGCFLRIGSIALPSSPRPIVRFVPHAQTQFSGARRCCSPTASLLASLPSQTARNQQT